jgi:hypothetical protein
MLKITRFACKKMTRRFFQAKRIFLPNFLKISTRKGAKTKSIMTKTININKVRRAISVAYNVNANYIPEEIEDQFINLRKAA